MPTLDTNPDRARSRRAAQRSPCSPPWRRRVAQAPDRRRRPRASAPIMAAAPCGGVDIAPVVQMTVGKSTVIKPTDADHAHPARQPRAGPRRAPRRKQEQEREGGGSGDAAFATSSAPAWPTSTCCCSSPSEVYLLGKSIGSTNVVMLDRTGRCTAFDVVVGMDTTSLQAVISQLLPDEKGIRVNAAFDSIVLIGHRERRRRAGQGDRARQRLCARHRRERRDGDGANPRIVNMLSLGAPQQVMLEVKVAEVSKALLDQLGINFSRAYLPGDGRGCASCPASSVAAAARWPDLGTNQASAELGRQRDRRHITGSTGMAATAASSAATSRARRQQRPRHYTTTYGTVPGRGVTSGTLNMQKTTAWSRSWPSRT